MQQQHRAEQRRAAQGGRYCREGGGNCTPRGDDGTTVLRVPSPHSQRPVRGKRVPVSPVHKRRSQRALFPLVSPLCRASRCSTGGGGAQFAPTARPVGFSARRAPFPITLREDFRGRCMEAAPPQEGRSWTRRPLPSARTAPSHSPTAGTESPHGGAAPRRRFAACRPRGRSPQPGTHRRQPPHRAALTGSPRERTERGATAAGKGQKAQRERGPTQPESSGRFSRRPPLPSGCREGGGATVRGCGRRRGRGLARGGGAPGARSRWSRSRRHFGFAASVGAGPKRRPLGPGPALAPSPRAAGRMRRGGARPRSRPCCR